MWCDLFLQKLSPLVWDGLTAYLQGVFLCVQRNRPIVTDSEQITAKLKVRASMYVTVLYFSLVQSLLDVFLTIKQTGLGSVALHTSRPKIAHPVDLRGTTSFHLRNN